MLDMATSRNLHCVRVWSILDLTWNPERAIIQINHNLNPIIILVIISFILTFTYLGDFISTLQVCYDRLLCKWESRIPVILLSVMIRWKLSHYLYKVSSGICVSKVLHKLSLSPKWDKTLSFYTQSFENYCVLLFCGETTHMKAKVTQGFNKGLYLVKGLKLSSDLFDTELAVGINYEENPDASCKPAA